MILECTKFRGGIMTWATDATNECEFNCMLPWNCSIPQQFRLLTRGVSVATAYVHMRVVACAMSEVEVLEESYPSNLGSTSVISTDCSVSSTVFFNVFFRESKFKEKKWTATYTVCDKYM